MEFGHWKGINHGYKSWDDPPSIRWFSRFTNPHCFWCGNFGLLGVNLPPLSGKKWFWNRTCKFGIVIIVGPSEILRFIHQWRVFIFVRIFLSLRIFSKYLKVASCECDRCQVFRSWMRACESLQFRPQVFTSYQLPSLKRTYLDVPLEVRING